MGFADNLFFSYTFFDKYRQTIYSIIVLKGGEKMNYEEIVRQIAQKENVPQHEVKHEIELALNSAGLDCNAEDFIELMAAIIKIKTIYR